MAETASACARLWEGVAAETVQSPSGGAIPFTVDFKSAGRAAIVGLMGEVDVATAPRLRHALDCVLDTAARRTVDATRVTCTDWAALGILLGSEARLRARGGRLVLACRAPVVRRVLAVTGLDALFTVRETRAEALLAMTASL